MLRTQKLKSTEEVKYLLQNSGMKSDDFFFNNYEIDFSRVGLSDAQIDNGIAMLKNADKFYICSVSSRESKIISTGEPEFYRVQIFLDQCRSKGKPLPLINSNVYLLQKYRYDSINDLKQAMQIMLMPLESYEDFIFNIKVVEKTFDRTIIYPDMQLGNLATWSLGDAKSVNDCFTVNSLGKDEWQILYWERGGSKVVITLFHEKHVYEYFMNLYLRVV